MRALILALAALAPTLTPASLLVSKPGGGTVDMPLKHTKVSIEVTAFVARATVEQVFENPFDAPVEAVYTFPLPDRAAVDDFELTVGERTIRGEIKRREEARAVYREARAAGYQAALLEQERPNIFTQSVANLEPRKPITVRLRTIETLRYERGTYRLAFPLVVGPRYVPGGAAGKDAACLNPPILAKDTRSGHDVSIEVSLDAGVPISNLTSPSHKIVSEARSVSRAFVRLADGDAIPNKDFLLRWSVASEKPAVGMLAHRDGLDGFFTLLVQPKGEIEAAEAMPKEIVFVLDTSGSMYGVPLDASKRLVAKALHAMGPRDTFNLIRFSGDNEAYSKSFLPNESRSVESALRWFEGQGGGGGTDILSALKAAFIAPPDPNRLRIVVFLTDGYVGNEPQILAEIGKVLGDARIYTIGIGSSVNHYLLDRMADLGRGAYVFVRPDEKADDALEAFRSWVTKPYLTDLSIDWGGLHVADFGSERLRDLGSGQTLTLVGRYLDAGDGDIVARGRLAGRAWEQRIHVKLPEKEARNEALAALWARGRIEELTLGAARGMNDAVQAEITALALQYRLMSAFTSFVAVDDSVVVNPGGISPTVHQAVPLPEGVSFEGIFGKEGPAGSRKLAVPQTVAAEKSKIDLDQTEWATRPSSDFIQDLPVAGRFYQNVLATAPGVQDPDGDGNPNVNGARERDFKTVVGGVVGGISSLGYVGGSAPMAVPPAVARKARLESPILPAPIPPADAFVLDAAFRVLADLADDGQLSPAEGTPALAALLGAQRPDGAVAADLGVHAVATWALAEAALERPAEAMVTQARAKALTYLVDVAKSGGAMNPEAARWSRLVLGSLDPGSASAIPAPMGPASAAYERLRSALAGSRSGAQVKSQPGYDAFDRLVSTIRRKNLKVVRA